MLKDIKDEILDTSSQLDGNPRYVIRDNNGNVVTDDAQIELKTPRIQEGTPLNKALFANLHGDVYTSDRYNTLIMSDENATEIIQANIMANAWVKTSNNTPTYIAENGAILTSEYELSSSPLTNAFDGDSNTYTSIKSSSASFGYIRIQFPSSRKISKMKYRVNSGLSVKIQGRRTTDASWTNLYSISNSTSTLTEVTLTNIDFYDFYQLYCEGGSAILCYEFQTVEVYYGSNYNLDLPLTSYEKGKILNINLAKEGTVSHVTGAKLNVNNLGAKTINGELILGQKHTLIYNDNSWDILQNVITGEISEMEFETSTVSYYLPLGFRPKAIYLAPTGNIQASDVVDLILINGLNYYYKTYVNGTKYSRISLCEDKLLYEGVYYDSHTFPKFHYVAFL